MNAIYLSVVDANNFLNSFGIDTQFLLDMRPWEVGHYDAVESLKIEANMQHDPVASTLFCYLMFVYSTEKLTHLANLRIKFYKLYRSSQIYLGEDVIEFPNTTIDGMFAASIPLSQVIPGDVFLIEVDVDDQFTRKTLHFRNIISGV